MKPCMFWTVPPSIIRSFLLYSQQWYTSYMFADSLQSGSGRSWSWSCLQAVTKPLWHIPLLCVQWKTPDDGQRNCPKNAEFHSKIKLWEIGASSWSCYKKFIAMHGDMNVKSFYIINCVTAFHSVRIWGQKKKRISEAVKSLSLGVAIIQFRYC